MVTEHTPHQLSEPYAQVLGAVGWMLDDACTPLYARVDVVFWGSHISMSVQGAEHPGRRRSPPMELGALRAQACAVRGGTLPNASGGHTERLRAIGRHVDEQGVWLERLTIGPTGYRVLGRLHSYTLAQWFPHQRTDGDLTHDVA
jgi:hypothetical protein